MQALQKQLKVSYCSLTADLPAHQHSQHVEASVAAGKHRSWRQLGTFKQMFQPVFLPPFVSFHSYLPHPPLFLTVICFMFPSGQWPHKDSGREG